MNMIFYQNFKWMNKWIWYFGNFFNELIYEYDILAFFFNEYEYEYDITAFFLMNK